MEQPASIIVTMAAYNAERTLEKTYNDIPPGLAQMVLVVDDASQDRTVEVARSLGLTVFVHPANLGYGGNQKTCYDEALQAGASIIVLLHPTISTTPRRLLRWLGRYLPAGQISPLDRALPAVEIPV